MKKYPHIKEVIRKSMERILAREKQLGRLLTIEELQQMSPSHSKGAEAALKAMKR